MHDAPILVRTFAGGSFNPAVYTGLLVQQCVVNSCGSAAAYFWLYWFAPLGGALCAAGLFKVVHALDVEEEHIYEIELEEANDAPTLELVKEPVERSNA